MNRVRNSYLAPRQVPKNASSRRCELAEREFSERVCEKLDDCWWSMKVTGKYSPGPKPFAKSHRLLALRALWAEKHDFCTIFVYSGLNTTFVRFRNDFCTIFVYSGLEGIYISPSYIDDDELLLEIPRIPITFVFRSFVNNIFVAPV
jgi:hypothetical protein